MTDVLARIREVLLESQKSQTEIGKAISKTPQYVWKLLNNDNANPSDSAKIFVARLTLTRIGFVRENCQRNLKQIKIFLLYVLT